MRWFSKVSSILCGLALLGSAVHSEVLQSSARGGSYWIVRDGAETRVSGPDGAEMRVDLPPGAVLYDLEPTSSGWLAAGRIPSAQGSELLLIESRGDEVELLDVPARGEGAFRGQPVLLIEHDHLVGLVWAEGNAHDRLAILAAAWTGGRWGPPELVSPPGPGSQLAPVGTILEDGSWLAVWPAFDGSDDEILWSRRGDGEWSAPQRVHPENDVFDLMPDVIAIAGGALVAWSWFDGNDYRLRTALFTDGAWSQAETLGAKGSVEPGLVQTEDGLRLLYKTVMPASWTVLDFDRRGKGRRRAALPVDTSERPLLLQDDSDRIRLHWPELQSRALSSFDHILEWQKHE